MYLPDLLTSKAEELIHNSDPARPFYLYFPTPLTHSSFEPFRDVQQTMPQYQLRPAVIQFSDAFPRRKRQLAAIQVR